MQHGSLTSDAAPCGGLSDKAQRFCSDGCIAHADGSRLSQLRLDIYTHPYQATKGNCHIDLYPATHSQQAHAHANPPTHIYTITHCNTGAGANT